MDLSNGMSFVEIKGIKKGTLEYREYQVVLSDIALSKSTMVVLSTGLGKTVIAALVAARRLQQCPKSKILFLAPSRPLVDQQANFLRKALDIKEELIVCMTGQDLPNRRKVMWSESIIFVMTPQALQNDLVQRSYNLNNVSLVVYDEAHRGVGDYAYTFIAEMYEKQREDRLSLGLTASPGHQIDHIKTVCENLRLTHVEARTETSPDVRRYLVPIKTDVKYVDLPSEIEVLRDILYGLLEDYRTPVVDHGFSMPDARRLSRKEILRTQARVRAEIGSYTKPPRNLFMVMKSLTACLRIVHLIEFVGTQGLTPTHRYIQGMHEEVRNKRSSKGLRDLLSRSEFRQFEHLLDALIARDYRHPKTTALLEIVGNQLSLDLDSRILVFTRFRDTAAEVVETLDKLNEARVSRFVGQSSKSLDKGFSQKKQVQVLTGFRNKEFNVLVATQVGEEGLDIPECNLVIFYDCVPSIVPYIQRRGRTGRKFPGRAVIFVARGTHDEFYHWSVISKLKKMPSALEGVEKESDDEQTILDEFASESDEEIDQEKETEPSLTISEDKIKIIVDSRELSSAVARELARLDMDISGESLQVGDYIASEDVAVERKEAGDFIQSLIDGRLFSQISALRSSYSRPVLIIEGEQLLGLRGINPESIYGALATIAIRNQVPMIWTRNAEETAHVLYRIARLEQISDKKPLRTRPADLRGTDAETLEYILSGFPGVDTVISRALLSEFGTLEKAFSASQKELQKVKGVGTKIAGRIRRLLRTRHPLHQEKTGSPDS